MFLKELKDSEESFIKKYPLTFSKKEKTDTLISEKYQKAWNTAKIASGILKDKFGAEKVFVFGSLTNKTRFNKWSDIDLAALGIPAHKFYAAVAAVADFDEEFKIDLIDIDDCKNSLRKTIEDEGIEI